MSAVIKDMPVADLAALICQHLQDHGIEAVLTGGTVVSIYSENEYESDDLDFITTARHHAVIESMARLGFVRNGARHFEHPDTKFFVEFPNPPLAIGNEPVKVIAEQRRPTGVLKLLSPTQCVMDRLAAFYYWDDRQARRQALMVARRHQIEWAEVERWSRSEGFAEKYQAFQATAAEPDPDR